MIGNEENEGLCPPELCSDTPARTPFEKGVLDFLKL